MLRRKTQQQQKHKNDCLRYRIAINFKNVVPTLPARVKVNEQQNDSNFNTSARVKEKSISVRNKQIKSFC